MNRDLNLQRARERTEPWDIVVIGGGATGAGCALDAASRGFSVLLLEQHDFGKGTSSRSTKLIHGGVRYLRQGNISLVREALKERGLLLRNAPHAIRKQPFVIPCYGRFDKAFYGVGMKIYDRLSGDQGIGGSRILSRDETLTHLRTINPKGLSGGVLYYDGQFDDARLLIDLLRTSSHHGAVVLNYARVTAITRSSRGRDSGVDLVDVETGEKISVNARTIINAAGIFADDIRRMSETDAPPKLTFAQGIHLVLDRRFLPAGDAVMIPKTSDGRVLFCIPWHEHIVVGTTDTPVRSAALEPTPLVSEIDFVLATAAAYLVGKPTQSDVLSVFAGIRPLVGAGAGAGARTSSLSRGHALFVAPSGLITITGGKWTTYRRMAEDAVDKAIEVGGLRKERCRTETLPVEPPENSEPGELLHPGFPYTRGDVIRAVRTEMARTVEDVLARRTRLLFINSAAAVHLAGSVSQILSRELGRDAEWAATQVEEFTRTAGNYRL